ncbi:MAG: DUF1772 domain-containing protein [Balneolaceae bacterium]|nr:DUF1772 domain-containing protein [Balneolaceae bacterium]MCH8547530.1 DUF1772 domain-containing protein [Balneolaceae bacterium]
MTTILLINLFSSFFLCGLIWTIQLVHYPMFRYLDSSEFLSHMNQHKSRISLIVVPVMVIELVSSGWLALSAEILRVYHITGLVVVIAIWLVTFLVQVPQHNRLSAGKDDEIIGKLVRGNWIRTLLWSAKSLIGIAILYQLL